MAIKLLEDDKNKKKQYSYMRKKWIICVKVNTIQSFI